MRSVAALLVVLCTAGFSAHADTMDAVNSMLFESGTGTLKSEFRRCATDADCTAVMSLCRWRPVNNFSEKRVAEISTAVTLPCKWPVPPKTPPVARCTRQLCTIPSDGKYY